MSNYIMDVNTKLTKSEYGNIYDYLAIIDVNDNFTMNIEDHNFINLDIVSKMFDENNIVKLQEAIYENGKCIIKGAKVY